MAHFDLVRAVVAKLRAVPTLNGSSGVGGRFYGARVPPDAPFPRSYTRTQRARRIRVGIGETTTDRIGMVDVLFACTSVETSDPEEWIADMDAAAEAAINNAVFDLADLVTFRRVQDIEVYEQEDDRLSFFVGGGSYEFLRQQP